MPYVGYKQFIYTTAAAVGYELHAYVYALSKISICDPQQSNYRIKTSASPRPALPPRHVRLCLAKHARLADVKPLDGLLIDDRPV